MSKKRAEQSAFSAQHELASVANDPSSSTSWPTWALNLTSDQDAKPPPLPAGTLPEVAYRDFNGYLIALGPRIDEFERDKVMAQTMAENMLLPEDMQAKQGQGLLQAMTEVPALFFQTAFDLDNPELWDSILDGKSEPMEKRGLEKLSQYLVSLLVCCDFEAMTGSSPYVFDPCTIGRCGNPPSARNSSPLRQFF
jgi:hypothetical protein